MVKLSIVERITALTNYDKRKFKKEEDSLVVSKEDKAISILSNGNYIDIKELPFFSRPSNGSGVLKLQTADRTGFIVQYGEGSTPIGSTVDVNFIETFSTRPFQVIITPRGNGMIDTKYSVSSISNNKFALQTSGGTYANFGFYWFAIGF